MTAIAGLWRLDGRPDAAQGCARMLEALEIYGPDAVGTWSDADIGLGRRLTRILPEDALDRQPLRGAGPSVLVADVRLDNREELSAALNISGESLRHLSDANVLLLAYERWNGACFDHIVGDYAFAVWDGSVRRLLLARDPMGMRPLYYHRSSTLFAFASMPKGLHALREVPYAANEERVAEFLALMPDRGSTTFFEGIEKVEAGCVVTVNATGLTARRHWEPSRRLLKLGSPDEYAEGLRAHLDQAVKCRLRGASDVAAQLSAGYDSSSVAATAARLLAPQGGRVHAFTAVPREGSEGRVPNRLNDEGPLAAATAALYPNMEHVLVRTDRRSPLENLDRHFTLYEQPMLNLCNMVWVDAIHDAARDRNLQVLLTANGGNMTLSYMGLELLPELIRAGRIGSWLREARALHSDKTSWPGVLWQSVGPWIPAVVARSASRLRGRPRPDVLTHSALRSERVDELNLRGRARDRDLDFAYGPRRDSFAARLWVFRRGNRGAHQKGVLARWRIDVRDPASDQRLIEFCLAVPTDQFLRNGRTRALAWRAFADRVPAQVLDAPLKGYQACDWHEGLTEAREALAQEVERLAACPPAVRTLAIERMRSMVLNWPGSGWERPEIVAAYRWALLRGMSAGYFLRRVAEANG
jgi:asparagine synthase (glutamine-hydrolysing)